MITGIGVVSPIGLGCEAYARSMAEGRSGVGPLTRFDARRLPMRFAAEVTDYDPKKVVKPRKSLKVMSRDIQLSYGAAQMAFDEAILPTAGLAPERLAVVFGADMIYCELEELELTFRACLEEGVFVPARWGTQSMEELYPLWMLKYLPNMSACHIGIVHDARGPNNTITLGEISSLAAVAEAVRVIERGAADVVIAGGGSSRLHPMPLVCRSDRLFSHRHEEPEQASRPFDARRDGMVNGEGAGAVILERRSHAERRGVPTLARLVSYASRCEPLADGVPATGLAIRNSLQAALEAADLLPEQIGHVNAHGLSTVEHDRVEAQAIHDVLGEVPVTAPKSYFGNLGAGTGAVELVASLLALRDSMIPATLNYEQPDAACPIQVVHGTAQPAAHPTAVVLNQTTTGQAITVVLSAD